MKLQEIVETLHREELWPCAEIPAEDLPPAWYIRALSTLGAWLATLFLGLFWAIFMHSESAMGMLGAGMCVLARVLVRMKRQELVGQLALSSWLTGCCLLSVGVNDLFSTRTMVEQTLMWLLLAVLYPESLGRFLTALGAGALAISMMDNLELPMDLLVGPLALLAGAHYLNQQSDWCRGRGRSLEPFAAAAVVTILAGLCTSFWRWCYMPVGAASTALLTLAVLWLTTRVISRLKVSPRQGLWALAGVFLLGIITQSTPGMMAGVGVLLLAREAHSRWLFGLGWLYLLLFTSAFYYNLDLLLRTKSLILVAVGALLLGLRRQVLRP
jgi:hypothetical protein